MKKTIIFVYLTSIICCVNFALAEEITSITSEPQSELEKNIIQQAEEQKGLQLKVYFRDYYYKQGIIYFKKHKYNEAIIEFEKALSWDAQYNPALRMIESSKLKMTAKLPAEERKQAIEEIERESQERIIKIDQTKEKTKQQVKIAQGEIKKTAVENVAQQEEAVSTVSLPSPEVIYRIDQEDVLEIFVWRHPELSREVIVLPDGRISFPLIGGVEAKGLTLVGLGESVKKKLGEFAQKRLKPSISEKPEEKLEYLIGLGDKLYISVWKIPDLSSEVIVRPDGKISYPLVGDLQAAGLTLVELREKLIKDFSSYVKEPQVSVMIRSFGWKNEIPADVLLEERPEVSVMLKKFGGRKVVVLGEVTRPGVYSFTGDIRLLEAVALAGDFTKYAVQKNVLVIRGNIHNNPQVITSNAFEIIKHAKLEENVLIQPQDVVFVPRSLIGNINTFIDYLSPSIDNVYKTVNTDQVIRDR